jgi:hypothetical protein
MAMEAMLGSTVAQALKESTPAAASQETTVNFQFINIVQPMVDGVC